MKAKLISCALCVAMLFAYSTTIATPTKKQKKKRTETTASYPYVQPKEKPNFELSAAMNRVYDNYKAATPQDNELYTQFKYSKLEGFDYHGHNGTVTRRDPSRIVKANGKYYMWYTLRNTPTIYMGPDKATETIPSVDWDLCDIGYATSEDGFTWTEQGVAVHRPEKPQLGWRSISTPDVLYYEGKYYLYYQAFSAISGQDGGDNCPVTMSWADSPDGPWTSVNEVVVENGAEGAWDHFSIHDPQPVVFNDKIYLYFKSDYNGYDNIIRSTGLAIADSPFGPFEKYEKNPVMSSGHETQMFRFKEGIASIMSKDGHEANTVQYAPDGKNFQLASICTMVPVAAGIYDPDAFTGAKYAKGISWGVSHVHVWGPSSHSYMIRFDCDLSLDVDDPILKKNIGMYGTEELLSRSLNEDQRSRIVEAAKEDLKK
ncbi:MAG: family 43 glycosylhydrolase [Rikenellaceae bacterium]